MELYTKAKKITASNNFCLSRKGENVDHLRKFETMMTEIKIDLKL